MQMTRADARRRPPRRSRRPRTAPGRRSSSVFAPVSSTASATVSKTGMPSTSWPPLPGVTPATTCVPYCLLRVPWNRPSRAGEPLDDELRALVDDDRHRPISVLSAADLAVDVRRRRRRATRAACARSAWSSLGRAGAREPGVERVRASRALRPPRRQPRRPRRTRATPPRCRSGRAIGSRSRSASSTVRSAVNSVSSTSTSRARDAGHLAARRPRRPEVVRRDAARRRRRRRRRRTGMCSAGARTSGAMPGAGSSVDDLEAGLAQPPRHVAAAGRDVERGVAPSRPRDEQLEVVALALLRPRRGTRSARSLQTSVMPPAPPRARAPSSIVASAWRFGGAGLLEDPPPLLRVRPVEPDDDRLASIVELVERLRGSRARPRRSA